MLQLIINCKAKLTAFAVKRCHDGITDGLVRSALLFVKLKHKKWAVKSVPIWNSLPAWKQFLSAGLYSLHAKLNSRRRPFQRLNLWGFTCYIRSDLVFRFIGNAANNYPKWLECLKWLFISVFPFQFYSNLLVAFAAEPAVSAMVSSVHCVHGFAVVGASVEGCCVDGA